MKYVFPNYSGQLISVCFLLNPKIPISQHRKHLPSLVINLSYVNEAGWWSCYFFLDVTKGPIRETADKGARSK